MTRRVQSRVVSSSPFIERRHSRRGSTDPGNAHRRATDGFGYGRRNRHPDDASTHSAFSGAERPCSERAAIGRELDAYA